jgi:hypothetical protein
MINKKKLIVLLAGCTVQFSALQVVTPLETGNTKKKKVKKKKKKKKKKKDTLTTSCMFPNVPFI